MFVPCSFLKITEFVLCVVFVTEVVMCFSDVTHKKKCVLGASEQHNNRRKVPLHLTSWENKVNAPCAAANW